MSSSSPLRCFWKSSSVIQSRLRSIPRLKVAWTLSEQHIIQGRLGALVDWLRALNLKAFSKHWGHSGSTGAWLQFSVIPDLSAPSSGSWVSWLSSQAMKSRGSLSSLFLLLSSVGVLLSQLDCCVSSGRSLRSSPGLCFPASSSPSLSSLSRLKPWLWPDLEARGESHKSYSPTLRCIPFRYGTL